VFPVRYELNFYILFRRNSVFKGLLAYKLTSLYLTLLFSLVDWFCYSMLMYRPVFHFYSNGPGINI
jgi:hypothetical protein